MLHTGSVRRPVGRARLEAGERSCLVRSTGALPERYALGAGGAMLVRGTAPGSRASSATKPDALLAVAALLSLLALLLQQQGFGQDTWAAVGVVF